MDFARRELEKYGWTKGNILFTGCVRPVVFGLFWIKVFSCKGLGKTQSGITEALKPKVKLNRGGIGHNFAKEHTDHWWERSFNNAASNIKVEVCEDEIAIKSSKKESNKNKKKDLYLGFIQKGTNMTSDSEHPEEKMECNEILIPKLSDEELFKACGGRTSHKAARHGLNLSGKLARIQQQEEEALLAIQSVSKTKRKQKDKDKNAKRIKT